MAATAATGILAGCEGAPARSRPWRHAPEPSAEEVPSAVGHILAGEEDRLAAMQARGDTFTVWLDADPRTLVPLVDPSEWTLRITGDAVFETLLHHRPGSGPSDPGGYEPLLARSWRVADGGKLVVLDLQPDVRFHDDRALSSVDVQFSLDAARSPRTGADALRRMMANVSAVELAGPRGVRIYLHRPDAGLLRALSEVPILPAHVYQGRLRGGPGAPVIGTGPYRLAGVEDGTIRLSRFAGYRGEAPQVEHIVFRREPDAARALSMLRGGEIDLVPALIPVHAGEVKRRAGGAVELETVRLRPPALRYLALNARGVPFDDASVRCALHHLIDREALVQASRGTARAVHGPIWPGGPGDGPVSPAPAGNREAALAALDAAGWRAGPDGIRGRGGRRLLLTVLVSDREDRERDLVLEQLRAAGFVLDTRVGSTAVLDNRLRDGKFDLAFVEWRGTAGSDLAPLLASGGSQNAGGFSDPRVDAALAGLRETWDPAARWKGMEQLGRLLAETCPIVPLTAPDPVGLMSRRVRGFQVRGGWARLRDVSLASGR